MLGLACVTLTPDAADWPHTHSHSVMGHYGNVMNTNGS